MRLSLSNILWRYYNGRRPLIGRWTVKQGLLRGRNIASPHMLLPPFVSVQELRAMLGVSYSVCFEQMGVTYEGSKYKWRDFENRVFVTETPRNVIVPFDVAAEVAKSYNYEPFCVNPEPFWDHLTEKDASALPVVTLFGNTQHGKTALFDKLTDSNFVKSEPGCLTQNLRFSTASLYETPDAMTNLQKYTLIDTPGHSTFITSRNWALSHTDMAIFVVSLDTNINSDTVSHLSCLNQMDIPLVIALTNRDMPLVNPNSHKSEIQKLCQLMYNEKTLSKNYRMEIENALPLSAVTNDGIQDLKKWLWQQCNSHSFPLQTIQPFRSLDEPVDPFPSIKRRTDMLVGISNDTQGVGIVLDIQKTHMHGFELCIVIRYGKIEIGDYYVFGASFGRIRGLTLIEGNKASSIKCGYIGMSVLVKGSKNLCELNITDLFITLPQYRAYRIAQYRQRILDMKRCQISGPPLLSSFTPTMLHNKFHSKQEPFHLQLKLENRIEKEAPCRPEPMSPSKSILIPVIAANQIENEDQKESWETKVARHNQALTMKWIQEGHFHTLPSTDEYDTDLNSTTKPTEEPFPNSDPFPCVAIIVRTQSLNSFNQIHECLDHLETLYPSSFPIVHGGIGPVVPSDIVHAKVENRNAPCPIYAFNTEVLPDALKESLANQVVIKRYDTLQNLLHDIENRFFKLKAA